MLDVILRKLSVGSPIYKKGDFEIYEITKEQMAYLKFHGYVTLVMNYRHDQYDITDPVYMFDFMKYPKLLNFYLHWMVCV